MKNILGIYQIQSISHPERCYIGSSVNIKERWRLHLKDLKNNKHHSSKLQRHYNKYGKDDLVFSVLVTCEKDQLIQFEQYHLDFYHPWFNSSPTAGSSLGVKRTAEMKKKYALSKIGNKHAIGNKARFKKGHATWLGKHLPEAMKKHLSEINKKPIFQYDRDMNFIRGWDSVINASRCLCINKGNISCCALGLRKSAGNFIWMYK
jgi:group I intron endonuclease